VSTVVGCGCSNDDSAGQWHTGGRSHLYADSHRASLPSSLAASQRPLIVVIIVIVGVLDVAVQQQCRHHAEDNLSTCRGATKLQLPTTRPARHSRLEAE